MQQLHQTTRQKRALLQLSLAAAQQQQCCRRRAAQPVEETRLVQKDIRQGLPASGNVAQKTLVQRSDLHVSDAAILQDRYGFTASTWQGHLKAYGIASLTAKDGRLHSIMIIM